MFDKGRRLPKSMIAKIRFYYSKSFSIYQTARKYKLAYNTVSKYIKSNKIPNLGRPKDQTPFRNTTIYSYINYFTLKFPHRQAKHLKESIEQRFQLNISLSTLCKIKKRLDIKKKRVNVIASQRFTPRIIYLRKAFCKIMRQLERENVIWVDETHVKSKDLNHRYAFILPGRNNSIVLPFASNINCSFIVAMGYNSVLSVYFKDSSNGGCNEVDYIDFLDEIEFEDDSILLQDNASIHANEMVNNFIKNKGIRVINNVPYCCDYNAIELLFNMIKRTLLSTTVTKDTIRDKFIDIANIISENTIQSFVDKVYERYFIDSI